MRRTCILVSIFIAGILLAGQSESNLAEDVRAHINERMYDSCRDVVLRHKADAIYQGHAEFLNGVKVDLEVTVSNGRINYRFLGRRQSESEDMQARLADLETLIVELEAEITRLTQLCLDAGIDVSVPLPETETSRPDDPNATPIEPQPEPSATDMETQDHADEITTRFTWQLYEEIHKGMSHAEVIDILGDDGHLISGSYFDNAENEIIVWTNPDDSHICIVFRDGRVLVKTQFGLPESQPEPSH
jgi:hypothetical protein